MYAGGGETFREDGKYRALMGVHQKKVRGVYMLLRRLVSFVLVLTLLCVELPMMLQLDSRSASAEMVFTDSEEISIGDEEVDTTEEDMYQGVAVDNVQTYPTLKRGDRDGDDSAANIVILQNRLIALEYLFDSADGVYGENTEIAVQLFQREHNLEETGIADPRTQNVLYSDRAQKAPVRMDSKNVVSRVQQKLILWGFHEGTVDGVNGSKTKDAVEEFKTYLKGYMQVYPTPSPEPMVTPDPATVLGFGDAAVAIDTPIIVEKHGDINQDVLDFVDGKYDFEIYRQTVRSGDKGDEVKRVQMRLKQLKYLWNADGAFGATTERALLYFQRKNGLDQTGIADEATQRLLFSDNAVVSEEFVNAYKLVVDISEQRVYVYQWDGASYSILLGKAKCSTGILNDPETATPLGTYQMGGPTGTGEWYYFDEFNCYAKWASRIVGGILFHSVVYSENKKLRIGTVRKLGRPASHGCVRLEVAKAKWIYDNCAPGTTCVIQK